MKQIKVDSCNNCPFIEHGVLCTHPSTSGMVIDDNDIIDPDCPLEDLAKE